MSSKKKKQHSKKNIKKKKRKQQRTPKTITTRTSNTTRKTSQWENKKPEKANQYKKYGVALIVLLLVIGILLFQIKKLSSQIDVLNLEKNKVEDTYVFVGDSITHRYDLEKYYPEFKTINSGFEGHRTEDILNDMNHRIFQYRPSKVILLIGINQIERDSEEQIVSEIEKIVKEIEDYDKNITVYVESLYPVNSKIVNSAAASKDNKKIIKINKLLKEYCKESGIQYIDIYDSLLDENENLKEEYTTDGLHISEAGYKIITKIVQQELNSK